MTAPLRTYEFMLSAADALGWESLPREHGGWVKFGFLLPLFLAGMATAFLPEEWTAGWWRYAVALALVLLVYLLGIVVLTRRNYARARRRFPRPVTVQLEDWGHSLSVRQGGTERHLADETIAVVIPATSHLFLVTGKDVLILQRVAFGPGELEALAARIEAAGRDPEEQE